MVLRAQVSEAVWFSTFNDAVAVADDKMSLRLRVPNSYVRERILTRYMSLVRDALNEVGTDRQLLVDVQTNQMTFRARVDPITEALSGAACT